MKWAVVRKRLKRDLSVPDPTPADRFWTGFRERIRFETPSDRTGTPERSVAARPPAGTRLWARRTLVPAAAAVVVAVLLHFRQSGPEPRVPNRHFTAAVLSTVEDIDVFMDYDSVFIIEDPKARGTLVWVAGANAAKPGG